MSTRVNVWFNTHETKKLQSKCEDCGLSPYAYVKELTLKDLYQNVRKKGQSKRVDGVETKNRKSDIGDKESNRKPEENGA